jgi:hypothetical protein
MKALFWTSLIKLLARYDDPNARASIVQSAIAELGPVPNEYAEAVRAALQPPAANPELEFRANANQLSAATIFAASHCTVCNRRPDSVEITEDFTSFNPTITIRCHGQKWRQPLPNLLELEATLRFVVPPPPNQLTNP